MRPRERKIEIKRELKTLEIGHCYHCEAKALTNTFCQQWNTWSCKDCLVQHHRVHHDDCSVARDVLLNSADDRPVYRSFKLWLTRYDGHQFAITCKLGQKLEMEDHWLGTYLYFPSLMILVMEDRKAINDRILEALQKSA